jgi:hypothetical protein
MLLRRTVPFMAATVLNSPRAVEVSLYIAAMLSALRELLSPPPPERRSISFTADLEQKS